MTVTFACPLRFLAFPQDATRPFRLPRYNIHSGTVRIDRGAQGRPQCEFHGNRTFEPQPAGQMRTFFNIVLGILVTVLKACLHTLVSTVGMLALGAVVTVAGLYTWRRALRARSHP